MKAVTKSVVIAGCFFYGALAFAGTNNASATGGLTELPYTWAQISYVKFDFDDSDVDADGFGIDASFDVGSNVFITAGYVSAETDEFTVMANRGSIKASQLEIGLGYHHPLSTIVDIVPAISVVKVKNEPQGSFSNFASSEDDTGWSASLALRALVRPHFEIGGGINYSDVFDDESTAFDLRAMWYPVKRFGLGAGYAVSDDEKTVGLGAQVMF